MRRQHLSNTTLVSVLYFLVDLAGFQLTAVIFSLDLYLW